MYRPKVSYRPNQLSHWKSCWKIYLVHAEYEPIVQNILKYFIIKQSEFVLCRPIMQSQSTPPSLGTTTDSPPLALSSYQFHSKLKTFLIEQSFPPQSFAPTLVGSLAGPLTQLTVFTSVIFPSVVHFHLVHLRHSLWLIDWLIDWLTALRHISTERLLCQETLLNKISSRS